jgi:competence protein ComEC
MPKMRKSVRYCVYVLSLTAFSLVWYQFSGTTDIEAKVSFLSIGQGDAIFIQAPTGAQMIIDGGPKGSLIKALKTELPEGDTSIDVIVMTNPDTDHYAGFLELLETYSVGAVIESGVISKTKTYQEFEALVRKKKIPRIVARKGLEVVLDPVAPVSYKVLFPDRSTTGLTNNDASVVGRLVFGGSSVMFMGDATVKTESFLIGANPKEALQSDILKVGHHGSRTSTSQAFLSVVHPVTAVISAGKNNRYKHPHQEILDRLKQYGVGVMVTKDVGTVTFVYKNGIITLQTQK